MKREATAAPPASHDASASPVEGRRVSIDAVAFDLVLLGFLAALLLSLPESESARLVPLLVLVPTLLGVGFQLYVDLAPNRRGGVTKDMGTPSNVRTRQLLFAAWLLAFFVAAWITTFLLVMPIALFVIFRFVNRETLLASLALAAGMSAFVVVVFGLILGVRF